MSSNTINEDGRTKKTEKAVYAAISSLLSNLSFRKITVKGICEEALISRVAFYAHFIDKYDLLKHWLTEVWPKDFACKDNYERIEQELNCHIHENMAVLKNLVYDADAETLAVLFDFILSTMDLTLEKSNTEETYHKNIVLSHFYAGGFISYLSWQVKNRFPPDLPLMNRHLYEMIREFQDRQSK